MSEVSRRELFDLPEGLIYLDGNSLGALPRAVAARMAAVIQTEWGRGLIGSWSETVGGGWMDLPERVGDLIAPLVGVGPGELQVGDSTSVSLFKTMAAAVRRDPSRRAIVLERGTFPTDAHIAAGVAEYTGAELRLVDDVESALDEDVALVSLTHVDFRTGAMFDLARMTRAVHDAGALVQWDLCHSTGAVEVDLRAADADLAVGCTYKYLNGGPGSPAYIWVNPRLVEELRQPITGWMGDAAPFAMALEHRPRRGVRAFASGTPPVLGLAALEAALTVFDGVEMADIRAASLALTDRFIELVDQRIGIEVVTPRDHARRGSQVSLRHPDAYGIVQALIERGVVGDFRDPDIARLGFAPLYVTEADVEAAVEHLAAVLAGDEHLDPAYRERRAVT